MAHHLSTSSNKDDRMRLTHLADKIDYDIHSSTASDLFHTSSEVFCLVVDGVRGRIRHPFQKVELLRRSSRRDDVFPAKANSSGPPQRKEGAVKAFTYAPDLLAI